MNSRKRMVGIATVLMLVSALILVAAPVGAAKKPRPPATPVLYDVSISLLESSDGLSTEEACSMDGRLVMLKEADRNGSSLAADGTTGTSEADLWLVALPTFDGRCYPAYRTENLLFPNPGPGFFRIVFDRNGALETITWHFDVEAHMSPRDHGKGSNFVVKHKYALTSRSGLVWDGATGAVSGDFELWDYTNTDGPVWTLLAQPHLEFTMKVWQP